jgi:hypothetical protein
MSTATAPESTPPTTPQRKGWTAGRVVSVVIGSILGLSALGILAAGGVAIWATQVERDDSGYLTSDDESFSTRSSAVVSDVIDLGVPTDWVVGDVVGDLRLRVTSADADQEVFVGIAPRSAVDRYLADVDHLVVTDWAGGESWPYVADGGTPPTAPGDAGIWDEQVSGSGTQSLTWQPSGGEWRVVVMNADGAAGVSVTGDVGATAPALDWVALGLVVFGVVLLAGAVVLVTVPVVGASR